MISHIQRITILPDDGTQPFTIVARYESETNENRIDAMASTVMGYVIPGSHPLIAVDLHLTFALSDVESPDSTVKRVRIQGFNKPKP